MSILRVEAIKKTVQSGERIRTLFSDVTFSLEQGEFVALGGRSGSGKTTLLNIIAGIDSQDSGSIRFKDVILEHASETERSQLRLRSFGLVFQFFHLIPTMTLKENILLPAHLLGSPSKETRKYAEELLTTVGIEQLASQYPHQVSGGEAQRTAIARALINKPAVLLADEPTGNLDLENANTVLRLLRTLQQTQQFTILMVTHEDDVMSFADRSLQLAKGTIEQ